jgi:hypothetical protein
MCVRGVIHGCLGPPTRLYDMLCRGVVQVSKKVQVWGRLGGGSGEGSEWKRGGGEGCMIYLCI